jgi:hypothetical protein
MMRAFRPLRLLGRVPRAGARAGYVSLTKWVQRIQAMRHSDSRLGSLGHSEFAEGLAILRADAEAGRPVPPIGLDLMVLQSSNQ